MKPGKAILYTLVLVLPLFLLACCGKGNIKKKKPGSTFYLGKLTLVWEFREMAEDGNPRTDVALIIKGKQVRRVLIGSFYGRVTRTMTSDSEIREMRGGSLSGFMTFHSKTGHEVFARYDERMKRLVIVARRIDQGYSPGPYETVKVIPLHEELPDTGF